MVFVPEKRVRLLTDEQQALVDHPFKKNGVLVVQAYAGTGKTSTLYSFAGARPDHKMLYLAFNKSMAMEAQSKFRDLRHVTAQTLHSVAYKAIGHNYKDRLTGALPPELIQTAATFFLPKVHKYVASGVLNEYFGRFLGSAAATPEAFFRSFDEVTLDELDDQDVPVNALLDALVEIWQGVIKGKTKTGDYPMLHNAYLKMFQIAGQELPYDYILVDEAQDVTDCMIDLVIRQNVNRIFIGDSYQQIYGWNGAVDSLKKLSDAGADSLYLTRSFRCPDDVAECADQVLRLVKAPKTFKGNGTESDDESDSPSAFLGRANGSVFVDAYEHAKEGQKLHFLGGFQGYNFEILKTLAYLQSGKPYKIRDEHLRGFEDFEDLSAYAEKSDQMLMARCKIVKRHRMSVIKMYETIRAHEVDDKNDAARFYATAHKAKGAEWDNVYLGDDFLDVPGKTEQARVIKKGEFLPVRREEINLLYVAITRAKRALTCPAHYVLEDDAIRAFQACVGTGRIRLI
jgi:superfamily I DNA/RNA helicase